MAARTISWQEYHGMVVELDDRLQALHPKGSIYLHGIPRGGQLVALLLSYLSDRYVLVGENLLCGPSTSQLVLVDDVLETGLTFQKYTSIPATFAVLIDKSKANNIAPADVSIEEMVDRIWVKFPYEKLEMEQEAISQNQRGYDGKES